MTWSFLFTYLQLTTSFHSYVKEAFLVFYIIFSIMSISQKISWKQLMVSKCIPVATYGIIGSCCTLSHMLPLNQRCTQKGLECLEFDTLSQVRRFKTLETRHWPKIETLVPVIYRTQHKIGDFKLDNFKFS